MSILRESGTQSAFHVAAEVKAFKTSHPTKSLTGAMGLVRALKLSKKQPKKQCAKCEGTAKKKYGPRKETKKK